MRYYYYLFYFYFQMFKVVSVRFAIFRSVNLWYIIPTDCLLLQRERQRVKKAVRLCEEGCDEMWTCRWLPKFRCDVLPPVEGNTGVKIQ